MSTQTIRGRDGTELCAQTKTIADEIDDQIVTSTVDAIGTEILTTNAAEM